MTPMRRRPGEAAAFGPRERPGGAERSGDALVRLSATQVLSRITGAPLIPGNEVRLLRNAEQNYPAWREAIGAARSWIHFETYSFHADAVGREFAELLESKAREGVRVRVVYDWLGGLGAASSGFWRKLRRAGVETRCFNPPRVGDPLEWLRRDHRKIIVTDGGEGFISGLCVGQSWVGDAARGIAAWRDSGVRIRGPAVPELDRAFLQMWNSLARVQEITGEAGERARAPVRGHAALRIVPGEPNLGGLYRLDMLLAALARRSIWLTDAYFLGTPVYVQSLRAAALDGVDVRLLLPRTSDIPVARAVSRVGYRSLLEAGARIFEWNGPMLHAKTAVVDGAWSRVGSTNLNIASWLSNYEMDVLVEDAAFAQQMRAMYVEDLENATEIVLSQGRRVEAREPRKGLRPQRRWARKSAGGAAKGMVAMGRTVGSALARPQLLGPAEAPLLLGASGVLLAVGALAGFFPRIVGVVLAVACAWLVVALLLKALRIIRGARAADAGSGQPAEPLQSDGGRRL
jgi:cardiolipin synthase